jgi:hypothetical protein
MPSNLYVLAFGRLVTMQCRSELRLDPYGAERYAAACSNDELSALGVLADAVLSGRSGVRVFGHQSLNQILGDGRVGRIAFALLGKATRPVRAIFFDKTAKSNWSVGWHQDRTIAVRARRDVPGFGPWSIKAGVTHVEPPFAIMAGMITIRAHLDDCDADNAPLLVVPGSHRLGRVPVGQTAEVARKLGHVACPAGAGDIWVYATSIIHASERAMVPRRRRVLQVDYSNTPLPSGLEWLGVME